MRWGAEFLLPDPRVNVSAIDGGGAYADYRGESDTRGVVGDDGVVIGPPSALGSYARNLSDAGFKASALMRHPGLPTAPALTCRAAAPRSTGTAASRW